MSPVAFVGYVPSLILVLADDDDLLVARRNLLNVFHSVQSLDNAGSDGYRWCRRWQPVDELLGTRTSLVGELIRLPRDHRRRLIHIPIRGRRGGRVVVNLKGFKSINVSLNVRA